MSLPSGARSRTLFLAVLVAAATSAALVVPAVPAVGRVPVGGLGLPPHGEMPLLTSADRAARAGPPAHVPREVGPGTPWPGRLREAKERAAQLVEQSSADSPSDPIESPDADVFEGLNRPGIAAQNTSPPDPTGAVGPHDYIEMVNREVRVYGRDLVTVQATASLATFLDAPADNVFDPQIQWDQQAQRFEYAMVDVAGDGRYLAVGWSKTANPANLTTDWCRFFIATGSETNDYPKLGHNDAHLIVGVNVFGASGFVTARVWALPKPAAGSTSCAATGSALFWGTASEQLKTPDGDVVFTPVAVNTFGASTAGYVVAADYLTGDAELSIWSVQPSPETTVLLSLGEVAVSPISVPADASQPGTGYSLDTKDTRLTQAVGAADPDAGGALAIWTQHTIGGPGGRAVVRWYEIVPGAPSPLRQEGTISSADHSVFNGAISPAANGSSAAVNYNVGSGTLAAQIRARSRTAATPLGEMGGDLLLGASPGPNLDFTCNPTCRWGDYAGASPDPLDPNVVWGTNQLLGEHRGGTSAHWATRNFALAATGETDSSAPAASPPARRLFAPQTLGATVALNLSWPAATDANGIDAYQLQRKKGTRPWRTVSLATPTATSVDAGVQPNASYRFRLRAVDGAGNFGPWTVTDPSAVALLQEDAASVAYTGSFRRVSLSGASGGRVRRAGSAGRMATFTFTGASVAFVSTLGPSRGIAEVRLDGGSWTMLDLHAPALQPGRLVYAASNLASGAHQLQVRVTGTANPASSGTRIDIDAFLTHP